MKPIITAICCLLASTVHAETLSNEQFHGAWKQLAPTAIRSKIGASVAGWHFDDARLHINPNLEVTFSRKFESGEVEEIQGGSAHLHEEFLIVELPRKNGGKYKLVLAGWSTSSSKMLFGFFYLFNDEGLFNGWHMTFEPADEI